MSNIIGCPDRIRGGNWAALGSAFGHTGLAPYRDLLDLSRARSGMHNAFLVVIDKNSTFNNIILWRLVICHSRGTSLRFPGSGAHGSAICHTLCLKLKSSHRKALAFARQIERQGQTFGHRKYIKKKITKERRSRSSNPDLTCAYLSAAHLLLPCTLLLQTPIYETFRIRSTSFVLDASKYGDIGIRDTSLSSQYPLADCCDIRPEPVHRSIALIFNLISSLT